MVDYSKLCLRGRSGGSRFCQTSLIIYFASVSPRSDDRRNRVAFSSLLVVQLFTKKQKSRCNELDYDLDERVGMSAEHSVPLSSWTRTVKTHSSAHFREYYYG